LKSLFLHPSFKKILALGPAGGLALLWLTLPALAGLYLLYELAAVSEWLRSLGIWGLAIYALVFLVSSGLGILPTTAQAILGGWIFGLWYGLAAASTAFGGAALLGLLITRAVAGGQILDILDSKPEAAAIRKAILGGGFWKNTFMIALLRIPPQSPFAFTNFLFVSCGAPTGPFVLGTILGLLPRTALLMFLASAAASTGAADIQTFIKEGPGWTAAALGIGSVVLVMAIIGSVAKRALVQLKVDPAILRQR
jgi:uncharacterized membrane protein YdjX (TVP38/TMEM64 family)